MKRVEYYLAVKREWMSTESYTRWIKLENIMLCESNQEENEK